MRKRTKGQNPKRTRISNARNILNLCRRGTALSRADIARTLGLSHPASSAIVRELVQAGYLEVKAKRRGAIGSPSNLYGIAPDAAFSFGINIGRRSVQAVMLDLNCNVVRSETIPYDIPRVNVIMEYIRERISTWISEFAEVRQDRVIGIGICSPKYFGFRGEELGYPAWIAKEWTKFDPRGLFEDWHDFPVFEANDANAAALAENEIGLGKSVENFFYVFIGTFIGGGLILDGDLLPGPQGLAANYGPFPVTPSRLSSVEKNPDGFESLVRRASVYGLIRHMQSGGAPVTRVSDLAGLDEKFRYLIDEWQHDASDAIMQSIVGIASIIDVEAVIIDGALPTNLLAAVVAEIRALMREHPDRYLVVPELHTGEVGDQARAVGAAIVPFARRIWSTSDDTSEPDVDPADGSQTLPFLAGSAG
ncbi:ROK family transcriptional regulator [Roseisalinus antarcticus]|uniref:N-acetylmannosamine kinase n=1 Tax=Roseisalinus antarcticus TaxID=254357 RepID=A0A1Y5TEP9_9RHOB|nr:ROK family transcriptional regulator [Roseisalinus antarcticus]SLN62072.1 N-acetylmannosamine kinase [Roseisalinus antarcticus]